MKLIAYNVFVCSKNQSTPVIFPFYYSGLSVLSLCSPKIAKKSFEPFVVVLSSRTEFKVPFSPFRLHLKVRYTFLFVHHQCDYWGKRFEYIILLGMKDIDSQKPYMYGARTTGPYFRLMPVLLMIMKRDLLQDCRAEYK